jgi:TPR repeat protein
VGQYLHEGRAGERDIGRAFQLLREAAQLGVTHAMQELGLMYLRGDGVGKNPAEGMQYLQEGARRDDLECQYLYARHCYQTPESRNLAEAHRYYRRAHERGYESASCDYALMLIRGDGGVQNVAEGLRIYKQAATRNNAAALVNLGMLYAQGKCVPKDDAAAAGYYRQASDLNHVTGMLYWANYLKNGMGGVAQNLAQARELFFRAAEAKPVGDCRGMHMYARMCLAGEGGPQDPMRAYRYFEAASKNGWMPAKMKYAEMTLDDRIELPDRNPRQARLWIEDCVHAKMAGADELLKRLSGA